MKPADKNTKAHNVAELLTVKYYSIKLHPLLLKYKSAVLESLLEEETLDSLEAMERVLEKTLSVYLSVEDTFYH